MPERYLSYNEVVTRLRRSHAFVREVIRSGELPGDRKGPNGSFRILESTLDAYIVANPDVTRPIIPVVVTPPSMEKMRQRILTVQEAADLTRVSGMTIYRLIKTGELPATRVGRSWRIREEDLDAYLDSGYTHRDDVS